MKTTVKDDLSSLSLSFMSQTFHPSRSREVLPVWYPTSINSPPSIFGFDEQLHLPQKYFEVPCVPLYDVAWDVDH
jgi:hypothetical protein